MAEIVSDKRFYASIKHRIHCGVRVYLEGEPMRRKRKYLGLVLSREEWLELREAVIFPRDNATPEAIRQAVGEVSAVIDAILAANAPKQGVERLITKAAGEVKRLAGPTTKGSDHGS